MKLLGILVAAAILATTATRTASAWDAGTESRIHDAGSGGENPISILDTRPKWAESTDTNSSRVADCPAGYTNTGLTCYREPYIYSAPSVAGDCPSGYTNTGVSCYREPYIYSAPSVAGDCPSGYTNTGVSCYREPYIYAAASVPGDCPSGYTNTGVVCYRGPDTISAPSRLATCPSGYSNTGVSCFRGADSYSAPSQLPSCTGGGTNIGLFCSPPWEDFYCNSGYFLSGARCNRNCASGYSNTGETCFRTASTISLSNATCPSGYFKGTLDRCYQSCSFGYSNTGEFCQRNPDSLPLSQATCPSGYFQGLIAGRCNRSCQAGFTNTGEFCQRDADTISLSNAACPTGYFQGLIPGRCNANCNAEFTNTGEFCQRDADTISLSNATCPGGYFQGLIPGRCNKNCAAEFTNTGEFCQRDADSLSTASMSCAPGEQAIDILGVPRCYTNPVCGTGYDYFLLRCYVTPAATGTGGSVERTAVSTVVHHVKQSGNTHLWIVEQALDLLSRSGDPGAAAFVAAMNANRNDWQQGVWDGDAPSYVDYNGLGEDNHQGTHFYNAAGKDRKGDATSIVTYYGADDNSFDCTNSRECAAVQLAYVAGRNLGDVVPQTSKTAAYHLGLALHYMTDATQPMHTSGWYGASIPINGHPQWEYSVPYIQDRFPASSLSWDRRWIGGGASGAPDSVFYEAALKSNGFAPRLSDALHVDGGAGVATIEAFNGIGPYTGFNFYNDPDVDALTGEILRDAYQSTASYLYAVYAVHTNQLSSCDADADGDGICDPADNCPALANPDQIDRDNDGLGDPCDPTPVLYQCEDGIDNDGDGLVDAAEDRGCDGPSDPSERATPGSKFQCDDGIDNDGDGFVDAPADPGCPFPDATIENPECDDGIDNDQNGLTDFDDPKCSPKWPYWEALPCGLGAELALLMPLLSLAARRRRRAR